MFSNPSFHERELETTRFSERLGSGLHQLSLAILILSIASTPWFLGGAIPHARLVLHAGVVVASGLSLFGLIFLRKFQLRFPLLSLPLLGLALIGAVQLIPRFPHPATQMEHAVAADVRQSFPSELSTPTHPRTASPAETRLNISQLISLSLIVFVVQESARTVGQIIMLISGLTLSGISMAALSLSQQFGNVDAVVGNHWKISSTTPFGCFVNPNNAAGWLMVCLSGCLFLCGAASYRGHESSQPLRGSRNWANWSDRIWMKWTEFVGQISSMTSWQIMAVSGVILLLAAIAATLSRAGIVAAVLGLMAFALSRFRMGHWITTLIVVTVVLLCSCGFLILFELDTVVLSELQTLKDPVSESTGRLLHWTDSLHSCLDFPAIGTGLGAYRFSTLPYQQHFTGKWFQRADNQYVELLVEAGWLGFICLIVFAVISLRLVIQSLQSDKSLKKTRVLHTRRWLAGSAACSLAAVSGASFFDYGVSLPSVSAAFVLIASCLLATQSLVGSNSDATDDHSQNNRTRHSLSMLCRLVIWTSVLAISATMLPDTWAAVKAYQPVPEVERLLNRPDFEALAVNGDRLLEQLKTSADNRPDDPELQRLYVLFLRLNFERDLVERVVATLQTPATADQKNAFLKTVTAASLLQRLQSNEVAETVRNDAIRDLKMALAKRDWLTPSLNSLNRFPLMLSVSQSVCLYGIILNDAGMTSDALRYSKFIEPHDSPNLFVLGYCLLNHERENDAKQVWAQALSASDTVRGGILLEYSRLHGVKAALQNLGPESWESACRAALQCGTNIELQEELFRMAEELWEKAPPRFSTAVVLLRVSQLEAVEHSDQALKFLDEQIGSDPANLALRKTKAKILEKTGNNEHAYNEWLIIRSFSRDDVEADQSLKRLIRLPPTSLK